MYIVNGISYNISRRDIRSGANAPGIRATWQVKNEAAPDRGHQSGLTLGVLDKDGTIRAITEAESISRNTLAMTSRDFAAS
jgi:hypothetical protein